MPPESSPSPRAYARSIRATWSASTAGGKRQELRASGYDPFGPLGANFNLLIGSAAVDPVSRTDRIAPIARCGRAAV
jgi:hypothetical protein